MAADAIADVLTVRDLHVGFHIHGATVMAVDGVSFSVRESSTVALVGESGSGKSTVAQSIMGILPKVGRIERGEILYRDPKGANGVVDIAKLDRDGRQMRAIRGGQISIIFQEPMTSLSPVHTIGNQVDEALLLHRDVDRRSGRELTVETLRLVGFPDPQGAYKAYSFELSGGMRQRAMIAMALVCRPAILIADEPTTALDVTIQAQILKLMIDLQDELGMAVLIITHDLGIVANLAEEVVVMYHGRVVESGSCDDIFKRPEHPYLKALFTAVPRTNMAPGERLVPIRQIEPGKATLMRKRAEAGGNGAVAGPLLSVTGLTKKFTLRQQGFFGFGSKQELLAVDNVSFEVSRGECLGLVGESGCGKTTTSKLILRALSADAGEVVYHDRGRPVDVLALNDEGLHAFRRKVQFIFQDPFGSLNPRMTALDIITEPLIVHKVGTPEERIEMVKELMRLVGLDVRFLRRYPHSFSGGQRQRLGIARALALQPELLICDEPVSSLDVSIQAQILNLLKDLQSELGLTFLFISHNLAVVDYMSDRIAVMCRGRLVEIAPRDALFSRPIHPYTRALLAAVPYPDPDRKLDYEHLSAIKTASSGVFPAPFTLLDGIESELIRVGEAHFVRAAANTQPEVLLS
ncbi:MAG: ABC transporter ATP-binding protein [Proteobacteria bacterium]|nr:ABC transporter ATP-binding protein [Pseudomonadota bacterium]